MAGGNPVIPIAKAPISDDAGLVTLVWRSFFELIATYVTTLTTAINAVPGVNFKTVAQLNALGLVLADAGYVAQATDTEHWVTWNGAGWRPIDGDESGRIEYFVSAPTGPGWALCDGAATTRLTFGATLTLAAFTTPNLTGTPAYLKSAAAYTGTINAAGGASGATTPGLSGATAAAGSHDHGGTTGDESAHTHGINLTSAVNDIAQNAAAGADFGAAKNGHIHIVSGTSDAGSAHHHSITTQADHTHGVGTLAVASHTHGVGTLDVANLGALPYVRR
jgi:hypothetical protein